MGIPPIQPRAPAAPPALALAEEQEEQEEARKPTAAQARWALMKTRMLAMAWEREREFSRRAQAWGFVSRMMVSRDGAGSSHIHC